MLIVEIAIEEEEEGGGKEWAETRGKGLPPSRPILIDTVLLSTRIPYSFTLIRSAYRIDIVP